MKLEKRTILITGGTSGIGLELAKQLHGRGNTVIVTGRDQEKLDTVGRTLVGVHTIQSDVSDPGAIAALYDTVIARFPALDTLINNAGIMRNLNLNQERDLHDVTREIEINLSGPVRMVQQFLPHLKTRDHALILNVSSGLAFIPFPLSPVYSATKAAIHAFTQVLRLQLDGTGVTGDRVSPAPRGDAAAARRISRRRCRGSRAWRRRRSCGAPSPGSRRASWKSAPASAMC